MCARSLEDDGEFFSETAEWSEDDLAIVIGCGRTGQIGRGRPY